MPWCFVPKSSVGNPSYSTNCKYCFIHNGGEIMASENKAAGHILSTVRNPREIKNYCLVCFLLFLQFRNSSNGQCCRWTWPRISYSLTSFSLVLGLQACTSKLDYGILRIKPSALLLLNKLSANWAISIATLIFNCIILLFFAFNTNSFTVYLYILWLVQHIH